MSNQTARKKVLISECVEFLDLARDSVLHTSQLDPLIATSMEETLALARDWKPDVLILGPKDVGSLCEALKSQDEYRNIPLIAMMDRHDENAKAQVFTSGADDWLSFPIDERVALARLQELTGVRFRKLPRYFYTAPATVSFKGKDFSATSIDLNRSMIFLETEEGLAPATGRNVKLKFKLSAEETIVCWGRVMRLMARQIPKEGKEAIGMLIRFLDLPELFADRIEFLAVSQSEHFLEPENAAAIPQFQWFDFPFYEKICLDMQSENATPTTGEFSKLTLPFTIAQIYIRNLSITERECLSGLNPDPLMKKTIVTRFKLIDELHKLRKGASPQHAAQSLAEGHALKKEIQDKINHLVVLGEQESLVEWSRVKFDLIRSILEMDFICRRRITLKNLYEKKKIQPASGPKPKRFDWKVPALIVSVGLIALLLVTKMQAPTPSSRLREVTPSLWGAAGNHLINAQVIKLGVGQHSIASGVLGPSWSGLAPDEKQILLRSLFQQLKTQEKIKGLYLFDLNGNLLVSFQNDRLETF